MEELKLNLYAIAWLILLVTICVSFGGGLIGALVLFALQAILALVQGNWILTRARIDTVELIERYGEEIEDVIYYHKNKHDDDTTD